MAFKQIELVQCNAFKSLTLKSLWPHYTIRDDRKAQLNQHTSSAARTCMDLAEAAQYLTTLHGVLPRMQRNNVTTKASGAVAVAVSAAAAAVAVAVAVASSSLYHFSYAWKAYCFGL
uniref:Uncharacterized protein n=1 Tax=Glossina palpalis gambiensis TaxID=67801 RepID=A0A1B0AYK0_9MUSC